MDWHDSALRNGIDADGLREGLGGGGMKEYRSSMHAYDTDFAEIVEA